MKALKFKVNIKNLENKIYRIITIPEDKPLSLLVYTILASFKAKAYHLYKIKYDGYYYESFKGDDYKIDLAKETYFKDLYLDEVPNMELIYDFGTPTYFEITYIETIDNCNKIEIIEGKGYGMIDDISSDELEDIVKDIDLTNELDYYFINEDEKEEVYDYRKYDIDLDNKHLLSKIDIITKSYEPNR